MEWESLGTDEPKQYYIASASISIIALVFNNILSLVICFGLVVRSSRKVVEKRLCGATKWFAAGLSAFTLCLLFSSWALFIDFPAALYKTHLCPDHIIPNYTEGLWCSSFIGTTSFTVLHLPPPCYTTYHNSLTTSFTPRCLKRWRG